MRIAVLGTGRVGGTLAVRWAAAGHEVCLGSRSPDRPELESLTRDSPGELAVGNCETAAESADVVLLAVPWQAAQETLHSAGNLADKVVIDCINPINDSFTGLDLGFSTSAAERVAEWAPSARVVKAFNTVSTATLADPAYGSSQATMFYCGDDEEAKKVVHKLAEDLALEAVDAGKLEMARYLEPLAMLYIQIAIKHGWGANCAFKILQR